MPESFVSGSPLRHSKNSAALNSLPAALPAPLEASVGIAHCAASPHTHNPSAEPARRDLHRISKAFGKNWRHSESFDTKKPPPSLWSVKETKTPSEAPFKLFEGVPFFLSFYLIEIGPGSIKNRGDAHADGADLGTRIEICRPGFDSFSMFGAKSCLRWRFGP